MPPNFRLWAKLALLLGTAALIWGLSASRAHWKGKFEALNAQASDVLFALREATDNPGLSWRDARAQVSSLGASLDAWRDTSKLQSDRIDALGVETARLKALNEELRKRAEAAIRKRETAIARLADQAISPGDRADCVAQLRDAEDALDQVWREGL